MLTAFLKKFTASLTAVSIALTSFVMPTHAYAQSVMSDPLKSRMECGRTPTGACEWQERVPLDQWEEVASFHNPQGSTPVDGTQYFKGERWMAIGQEAAGILGLSSSQIVLETMQQQIAQPPWVIARYMLETNELSVHAVKVIKTPDGYQRVMVADYTPDHGRWHVVWRHFLRPEEKRNPYVRGIDPFTNFRSGGRVFRNVNASAAQAIVGQAMMHFQAPYGLFVEPQLRLNQWQTRSGSKFRRKITTHTEGYAKPVISLITPLAMSPHRNTATPVMLGMYCPRGNGACQMQDELVTSGFILQPMSGGNVPDIEERLFYETESKRSWTVLSFALLAAAVVFTGGAAMAGSMNWGFVAGQGVVAGGAVGGVAAGTISAAAGAIYGVGSLIGGASGLGSAKSGIFEGSPDVSSGTAAANDPGNKWARRLWNETSAKHIHSGNPGTVHAGNNLRGTNMIVQGDCPLDWGIQQCRDAGLDPGQAPRKDMHTNRALNTSDYTRKVQACKLNGYGYNEEILNYCLATAVFIEPPAQ